MYKDIKVVDYTEDFSKFKFQVLNESNNKVNFELKRTQGNLFALNRVAKEKINKTRQLITIEPNFSMRDITLKVMNVLNGFKEFIVLESKPYYLNFYLDGMYYEALGNESSDITAVFRVGKDRKLAYKGYSYGLFGPKGVLQSDTIKILDTMVRSK